MSEIKSSKKSKEKYDAQFYFYSMLAGMIIGVASIYFIVNYEHRRYREENLTYKRQMEALDEFQKNIDNLSEFVVKQRSQLKREQDTLERMLDQKQTLRPLLEADQQVVDALFKMQAEKNRRDKWIDRLLGFLSGIAASVIAYFFSKLIERRLNQPKLP